MASVRAFLTTFFAPHEGRRARLHEAGLGVLLVIQAAFMFVVVPLVVTGVEHARLFLSLFQLLLGLVTVAMIAEGLASRLAIVVSFGATLFVSELSLNQFIPSASLISHFVFNAVVTWVIAAGVFRDENVTHHRILGAAVVYLNLAWLFAMIYRESASFLPHAFANNAAGAGEQLGQLLYFSLSTLSTSCFGDILPVHPAVRSIANLEAIVGQFFLAVLVSRLVGLHVARKVASSLSAS